MPGLRLLRDLLLVWLIVLACSDRPRSNPLDPLNIHTRGRPVGVFAAAEYQRVIVGWVPITQVPLAGYRLYRQEQGKPDTEMVYNVAVGISRFRDLQVQNDITYSYALAALTTAGFESPRSEVALATPGPDACWIADAGLLEVIKSSSDGRARILTVTTPFLSPGSVSVNPTDGSCWVADRFNRVVRLSSEGTEQASFSLLSLFPLVVAVDPRDGSCWIGATTEQGGTVGKLSAEGLAETFVTNFGNPRALAVDPRSGACWVADAQTNQVVRLSADTQSALVIDGFSNPVAIAVNGTNGDCWIAAGSQVTRLDSQGQRILTVTGFVTPLSLSVNATDGTCWVADPGRGVVYKLDGAIPDGYDVNRDRGAHLTITGLEAPRAVAINSVNGTCWIADAGARMVLKVTADGHTIGQLTQLDTPLALAVDPGTRF